jgi:hypothetical protein
MIIANKTKLYRFYIVSKSKPIDLVDLVNELDYLLLPKLTIPKTNVLPYLNVISDPNGPSEFGKLGKSG